MTMSTGGADDRAPTGQPTRLARIAAWPLLALIRLYQLAISPALPQSCRYYPSCSSYAVQAIERFGPLVGPWLAARRLLRCHPWSDGGVDHVPPRGRHGRPDWEAHRSGALRREAELVEACGAHASHETLAGDPGVTIGGQPSRPRGMH